MLPVTWVYTLAACFWIQADVRLHHPPHLVSSSERPNAEGTGDSLGAAGYRVQRAKVIVGEVAGAVHGGTVHEPQVPARRRDLSNRAP